MNGGQKASHFAIYVINFGDNNMKLTEKKIKQIILEELQSILENPEQEEQGDGIEQEEQPEPDSVEKLLPNVDYINKMIQSKIKQPKEYNQLLQTMLKFKPEAMSDSIKIVILRQLRDLIITLLK